jgi:transcriptional regulator with XRE-family HTH domain
MTFNPSRLSCAMGYRMLSRWDVASNIGVQVSSVTKWLQGTAEPTDEQIVKIAEIADLPEKFFYGPDLTEPMNFHMCRTGSGR